MSLKNPKPHFSSADDFMICPATEQKGQFRYWRIECNEGKSSESQSQFLVLPYANPAKVPFSTLKFSLFERESINISFENDSRQLKLSAGTSKERYVQKVRDLKKEIQLGNIYEINFCMEFFAENVEIDPLNIFCKLNELAKAPYSYLVKIKDEYIICASPELFLKKEGNVLSTKPIKGTAPRGKSREEDEKLKEELFHNIKERTENVMAVDVARNDLSIIAERGSVEVNKLYNIETYETVHQMVSTVKCKMASSFAKASEDRDGIPIAIGRQMGDIISATFPMASMTGAPKKSAMNFIDEFEDFERKYYSGAMGIIDEKGDFELCVIIRSIFYNEKTKRLSIAVGSAITHLCDPEKEYEECLLKAGTMLKALNAVIV
jgi:para-aminobenzoate synthetase component 1